MFDTIEEVTQFYNNTVVVNDGEAKGHQLTMGEKHDLIYRLFNNNVIEKEPKLSTAFHATEGFGELPFQWNWYLAVKEAMTSFRFLEVGVYKGRVLATIQWLATAMGKSATIVGVTPLSGVGDKYSGYDEVDYFAAIRSAFEKTHGATFANTRIIKGYSQDPITLVEAAKEGPFDIIFIDGCHDYDIVIQDIDNYVPMLKEGGLLVMDDASLYIEAPAGRFHGHPDVGKAIKDRIDENRNLQHLFAVGHNRVWRKNRVSV